MEYKKYYENNTDQKNNHIKSIINTFSDKSSIQEIKKVKKSNLIQDKENIILTDTLGG